MELQIAAVNHNDPLCKHRLKQWLVNLLEVKLEPPGFIGVEWDEEIFEQIKQQRDILEQMAQHEWQKADPALVRVLSEAIGFEADTHKDVFPHVETLWLDQGRIVHDSTMLTRYAEDRMKIYRNFLSPDASALTKRSLEVMGKKAWGSAKLPAQRGTDRDKKFASKIWEALSSAQVKWSIAIVGALHASDSLNTMRVLLEAKGVLCKVSVLKA